MGGCMNAVRQCTHEAPSTGGRCTHQVLDSSAQCAAGHPNPHFVAAGVLAAGTSSHAAPVVDIADLVPTGPDQTPPASAAELAPLQFTDVIAWAQAGVTNPDVATALHAEGVTAEQAATPVVGLDGIPTTVAAAVEQGHIPAYDAPTVCATWPGVGWTFHPDRFAWSRRLDADTLAAIVREHAPEGFCDPGTAKLGARMAAELARQAHRHIGIDLIVARGDSPPAPGWADGLPGALFRHAATATTEAIADPAADPLADYARRWLVGDVDILTSIS